MPQPARNYCHLQKYKQHYPIKAADNTAQQMSGVSEENDKKSTTRFRHQNNGNIICWGFNYFVFLMIAVIFSASLSGAHDINTGEQHLKCEIIYEEIFFFH